MLRLVDKEEECSLEREKNERIHGGETSVNLGYTKLLVRRNFFWIYYSIRDTVARDSKLMILLEMLANDGEPRVDILFVTWVGI